MLAKAYSTVTSSSTSGLLVPDLIAECFNSNSGSSSTSTTSSSRV